MEKLDKSHLQSLCFNGYTWSGMERGVHTFSRQEPGKGYSIIQCDESQLSNGDIEFMTEHGITLGPDRITKAQRNFDKLAKVSLTA